MTGVYFYLFTLRADADAPTRIGITTSRKVGNAVRRNRLRRLVREVLREVLPKIAAGYKIVVVVRPRSEDAPMPTLAEVREEVVGLLEKSGTLPVGVSSAGVPMPTS